MRLPEWLAVLNRHVTNPVQRLWAGRLAPWAIVEHTGRVTGRVYRTPVLAHPTGDAPAATGGELAVLLYYGPDRDWIANLRAAGGGRLVRRGRRLAITGTSLAVGERAIRLLPDPLAWLADRLARREVLVLAVEPARRDAPGAA